jgi:hypothetical protein
MQYQEKSGNPWSINDGRHQRNILFLFSSLKKPVDGKNEGNNFLGK